MWRPATAARTGFCLLMGGYTLQMRNMDSWEGWFWGAKHVWGCEPVGEMMPMTNLYPDIAKHADLLCSGAATLKQRLWALSQSAAEPAVLLVYENRPQEHLCLSRT